MVKELIVVFAFLSRLQLALDNLVDNGDTFKEFKEAENIVTVDTGERNLILVFLLVLDLARFEAGGALSEDEDKVRLLVEICFD